VDAGVATGDSVSPHYDPLLAKIIVHASDRPTCLDRMREALAKTAILGIETNLSFLKAILADPVFRRGEATTSHVESAYADWRPPATGFPEEALIAAAVAEASHLEREQARPPLDATEEDVDRHSPWGRLDGFRTGTA
jgi:3-methylcrotonyl-CoA carboxylase alpha subunit